MKKYHIIILGCQMNISDAERVAAVLESVKYKKTSKINEADLIVVVMCSIRQSAVDRVHGLVQKFRKLKTTNYKLQTILTGCVLKKDKKIFVEGFDRVIDIREIAKLPELLARQQIRSVPRKAILHGSPRRAKNCRELSEPVAGRASASEELLPSDYFKIVPKYENQFSANVPIMTGCNNFCAYCVVPYIREREISRPAEDIIAEIKNLVKNGYKEIWLLGQNVNSYKGNYSLIRTNKRIVKFPELLKIVNDIPGDFWIRFTSSHPKDFKDDVIGAMADGGKISPYLNLPVQSGDDEVLKAMNRHYTIKEYKEKIKKLRKKIPDIAISTDIIVGFPGETKKQFLNTAKLFRDVKYDMAYINKYSSRAGTAAAKLKDNVSREEKKNREKILTNILKKTALTHNKKLVGRRVEVLINSQRNGFFFGKTNTYKTIKIPRKSISNSREYDIGDLVKVEITKAGPFTLEGKIT